MGFLTGLFCVICTIALINGGKPLAVPSWQDFFQFSPYNYLSQEPMNDPIASVADNVIESPITQKEHDLPHPVAWPLEMAAQSAKHLANEWRRTKGLNDKRDYNRDHLNEAYQHQRPFTAACDVCRADFKLFDLGYTHFPRFLVQAVCQGNSRQCRRGTKCREVPYKVRVLTYRNETDAIGDAELPDVLNSLFKFETFNVSVSCQCAD